MGRGFVHFIIMLSTGGWSALALGQGVPAPPLPSPLSAPPPAAPSSVKAAVNATPPAAPAPAPVPAPASAPTASTPASPAAPAPLSAPAPSSSAAPATPAGLWVYGNWKAWFLGGGTDLILVRNMSHGESVTAVEAPFAEPTLLRKLLTFGYKDFMQFGEQPMLEHAIDEACALHAKTSEGFPARSIEEVAHEMLGDAGADSMLKHPDKNTPYFVGSTLSTVVKPAKLTVAIAPLEITVVSAVASCKEPPGKRFRLAQKRGFETLVTNNVRALTWLIEKWIASKTPADASDEDRDKIKAQALSIAVKAIRITLSKMSEYQTWLAGPEGKELGGSSVWDAPLTPRAQAYARGLTQMLEQQLRSLSKEYDAGTARNAVIFPVIAEKDALTDVDLNVLFQAD